MNPRSYTSILSFVVVGVCSIRFLFDGITFSYGEHSFIVGHIDSLAYGSILTPVLVAHGYVKTRLDSINAVKMKVDNPDA